MKIKKPEDKKHYAINISGNALNSSWGQSYCFNEDHACYGMVKIILDYLKMQEAIELQKKAAKALTE